ncbi:MAG: dual specificity protein phosphatase family protein [Candidatus Omnitrophota bacterium]|nr:dual specificity protein phosphatase family protein [Candidatus Omnitrophota bacterium]
MHDKSMQPVFVHCQAGKDRTGMICAAYKMKYDNWSLENALFEMLVYGYSRSCCFQLEESLSAWNLWRKEKPLNP